MDLLPWLFLIYVFLAPSIVIQFVTSSCLKEGVMYQNGSTWMEDACTECRCETSLAICEPIICLHTGCDNTKGELWQAGKDCCPTCVSRRRSCQHGNTTHMDLTTWNPQPCTVCSCHDGRTTCRSIECNDVICEPGHVKRSQAGVCCPVCKPIKRHRGCTHHGKDYGDGSVWQPFACVLCSCSDSSFNCFNQRCPPTICAHGSRLLTLPGDCCPKCVSPPCENDGKLQQVGSLWKPDRCTWCKCESHGTVCHRQTCTPCQVDKDALWKEDRCCPLCVDKGKSCLHNGTPYHHTETWKASACDRYACHDGDVISSSTVCPDLTCSETEILKKEKGECCGRCVPLKVCQYNGMTRQSGETWKASSCDWYKCVAGLTQGFTFTCPDCPTGLSRQPVQGQCCGHCIPSLCSTTCLTCSPSEPSYCTSCSDPRLHLQEGRCTTQCTSDFYLHRNTCLACDPSCLTCSGPTFQHCLSCGSGTTWEDGTCTKSCSESHVLHKAICQACPLGCQHCTSTETCDACKGSYILQGERCLPRCPRRGLWNAHSLSCKENRRAPVIVAPGLLEGKAGVETQLTPSILNISDSDSPTDYIAYRLVQSPTNGKLVIIREGKSVVLRRGQKFTPEQIQAGRVFFQHERNSPLRGRLTVLAEDGRHRSPAKTIAVNLWTEQPPRVRMNEPLVVSKGQKSVISHRKHLHIEDEDSPGSVTVSIIRGPVKGRLVRDDDIDDVSAFSLRDLNADRIVYVHHANTSGNREEIILQISDGTNTLLTVFNIIITEPGSNDPVIVRNQHLYVDDQGEALITTDNLMAIHLSAAPGELIYSLRPPPNREQQNGSLLMVVPMTEQVPPPGWRPHGEGRMSAGLTRFRQSDVIEKRLWYKHRISGTTFDRLLFMVCDSARSPHCTQDFFFDVKVILPQNDAINNDPDYTPGLVFLPEETNRLETIAFDNEIKVLKATDLGTYVPNTDPEDVIYRVTSSLTAGEGTIERMDQPGVPVHIFTLADLAMDFIIYRPPLEGIGENDREVVFKFIVQDGNTGSELPEQAFHITVIPVKTNPPVATNSNPTLRIAQGASIPIGPGVIHVTDPDTPSADLVITVEKIPRAGVFLKMDGENRVILREGDQFDFGELESGLLFYMHDGSDTLNDGFYISVTDGQHSVGVNIVLHVSKVDQSAPRADPQSRMAITISEGATEKITRNHLAFTDGDSEDDELVVVLQVEPRSGRFVLAGVSGGSGMLATGTTFTQKDVNDGYVSFKAQAEIGPRPHTENVYMNVTDTIGNLLAGQQFTITTTPVNNKPPKVTLTDALEVDEGGRIPITLTDITVNDEDTLPEDIQVVIDLAPEYGTFENVRPAEGSEIQRSTKVVSFSMSEVINGNIHYVQGAHQNHEPTSDRVILHADDGVTSSPPLTLDIKILPINDEPPRLKVQILSCTEGGSVTITNETLVVTDIDTPSELIIFTIENTPTEGSLRIKANKKEVPFSARMLHAGETFTYNDVINEMLVYIQTTSAEVEITDAISLRVTDGDFTDTATIIINIKPRDDEAPRIIVNRGLRVPPGSGTVLTSLDLQATDLDSDDSILKYTITRGPTLGTWLLTLPPSGPSGPQGFVLEDEPSSAAAPDLTNDNNNEEILKRQRRSAPNDYPSQWVDVPNTQSLGSKHDILNAALDEDRWVEPDENPRIKAELLWDSRLDTSQFETLYLEGSHRNREHPGFLQPFHGPNSELVGANRRIEELGWTGRTPGGHTYPGSPIILTDGRVQKHPLPDGNPSPGEYPLPPLEQPAPIPSHRVRPGSVGISRPGISREHDTGGGSSSSGLGSGARGGRPELVPVGTAGPTGHTIEGSTIEVSADGLVHGFRQRDINEGRVQFVHSPGEPTGVSQTVFTVSDPEGNELIEQTFIVNIVDDRTPPRVVNNNELVVGEGGEAHITTNFLSASDGQVDPGSLRFSILQPPSYGHLAMSTQRDLPIAEFLQSDLAANGVVYVHTSSEEALNDRFTFSVSDGPNQVTRQFLLRITPVDNKLPTVINRGLRVQEGQEIVVSEFDLQITDPDTEEAELRVIITSRPQHGRLVIHQRGDRPSYSGFTMEDVYEGRVTYVHDGSETTEDSFRFRVTDGTNSRFIVDGKGETDKVQIFYINIQPVDDGSPRLLLNKGLHFLTHDEHVAVGAISNRELYAEDADSSPEEVVFRIKAQPAHGYISYINSTTPLQAFTQSDVSNGIVRYVLSGNMSVLQDQFTFDVMDSKPNTLMGSVFHLQWTVFKFEKAYYNTTETSGYIHIPVRRIGNTKQYSVVTCKTVPDTATSDPRESQLGKKDFTPVSGQVQFEGFEDKKSCKVAIRDDNVFEGPETFYLELSHPEFSLLGRPSRAAVTIYDREDESEIQFEFGEIAVNESVGILRVPLLRTGDVSTMATVMCHSQPITAQGSSMEMLDSGSDYQTRSQHHKSRVMFGEGSVQAFCDVRIIDDSFYEEDEQFELILSAPSMMTKLGEQRKSVITITGPNDIPGVYLDSPLYYVDEADGEVVVTVVRSGSDISSPITLWCSARPSTPISALPGEDFLPSPQEIKFQPGQKTQQCVIEIVDDASDMRLEGNETVEVYLYNVLGAVLEDPPASIIFINDTNEDVSVLQFEQESYIFDENSGSVSVPIIRTGDVTYETSVICFTRQRRARVMMDYVERPWTNESKVLFLPGQKVANCTVTLVDDEELEAEEDFLLRLADPVGFEHCGVRVGDLDRTTITIKDHQDIPLLEFEKPSYEVSEPPGEDSVFTLEVVVVRKGDQQTLVEVRCSTRDGSAIAGLDYDAHSQVITFLPGVSRIKFEVDILHNPGSEWQEMFTIILGPSMPTGAVLGAISQTTVVILDNEASGSLVFPAPPIVVSLLDYDDMTTGSNDLLSPGYPIICVTACDPKHPSFTITSPLCASSGVNQSAVVYRWEISTPSTVPDPLGIHSSFHTISGHLPFTRSNRKVLENIYFRPGYKIRCTVQPIDKNGRKSAPTTSDSVTIGSDNGLCRHIGWPHGIHGQSFVGKLEYIKPGSTLHSNTLHVNVKVPHHDGLIPLVSTQPIHNLQYLLTVPTYRQQHACSNFAPSRTNRSRPGFMYVAIDPVRGNLPYQFDEFLRGSETIDFYKHLNLRTCTWTFDAYFDMSDLVNLCNARVMTDFNVVDKARSRVSVRVPLYVAYVYNAGIGEWSSIDHRTELELSIMYDTMVWRAGLGTGLHIDEKDLTGDLQIIKVATNPRGNLVIEFKTRPNFRGMYLLAHPVHPEWRGTVISPSSLPITFQLEEVWSQPTFDSPQQHWRATSDLSLQDYSGDYTIKLIPCTVRPLERYPHDEVATTVCTPHTPKGFDVALTFQQTLRPLPAVYALATDFHITSNLNEFLMGPKQTVDLSGFDGVFNKDDRLYGRVLWSPSQDLKNAYKLQIEKVFVCTGIEGYVPTYDPTGEKFNSGPQYGCLHPNPRLAHRYMVLDRGDSTYTTKSIAGHNFDAEFATDNVEYRPLWDMPGIDGFTISIDPLYKVKSGNIWYLQVLYVIRPSRRRVRRKRSLSDLISQDYHNAQATLNHSQVNEYQSSDGRFGANGTNILILRLDFPLKSSLDDEITSENSLENFPNPESNSSSKQEPHTSQITVILMATLIVFLCLIFLAGVLLYLRRTRKKRMRKKTTSERVNLKVSVTNIDSAKESVLKTSVIANQDIQRQCDTTHAKSNISSQRLPRPVSV